MKSAVAVLAAAVTAAQPAVTTFGTGVSQGRITQTEKSLFFHQLQPSSTHGVITHWWITGGAASDNAIISFYLDGETTPSIRFVPYLACGVGFNDDSQVPWSTEWFSKESSAGAWSSKFRIPFQSSVNVTYKSGPGQPDNVIYMIVRGAENLPIVIGDVPLPTTARLQLQVTQGTYPALAFVPIASVASGAGMLFQHTLAFTAPNLNTLEGCYHAYFNNNTTWPGMIVSTGTEDLYDSSYYFAAGQFRGRNAGMTHIFTNSTFASLSAYRFFDKDPMAFANGFSFVWRNGDVTDPSTGLKCTSQTGNTVGSPGTANVVSYAWVYTW